MSKGGLLTTLAPANRDGRVAFSADLMILAPAAREKMNGTLFYLVNNRGRPRAPLGLLPMLFEDGYVVAMARPGIRPGCC